MRVAFFGGTLDPIHRGHLAIARAAADAFELDTVFFAPVGQQPLKPERAWASFADRLVMATLACGEDGRFAVSNLDAPREDGRPNYTVETLARLRHLLPEAEVFLLTGADSLLELRRWHQPDRVLELAEWIAVSRPGFDLGDLETLGLRPAQRARIHLIESVHVEVSATELRQRMVEGERCEDLLPGQVADYIAAHGLYRQAG